MGINTLCIFRLVTDSQRNREAKPNQGSNFFEKGNDLRVELHDQLELSLGICCSSTGADHVKETTGDGKVASLGDIADPSIIKRPSIELDSEGRALHLKFMAFCVRFPPFTQHVLYTFHVSQKLTFNLARPYDGRGHRREVSHLGHVVSLRVSIVLGELLAKTMDIFLDRFDETSLILLDGTTNLGSYKKSVKFGEDSKHFLGVSCRCKLIPQPRYDLIFDSCYSIIVSRFGSIPDL